jgi:dipeptidyl aminopeptidase/acylaminoacyl peptidase
MAMLYGYGFDNSHQISAIISFAGPADLTNTTNLTFFEILNLKQDIEYMVGAPFKIGEPLDAKYEAASPIFHVKNIPTLLVYGDEDILARYDLQALPMEAKLSSLGYTHKLVTLEGAGHTLGFEDPARMQTIVNEAITWITTYSK